MSRLLSPRALVGALRWLFATDSLPEAAAADRRVDPMRRALGWLLGREALAEAAPAPVSKDIGFFRWLLARERLPADPELSPHHTPQEGVDAAG